MIQFYFMSILFNFIAGFLLSRMDSSETSGLAAVLDFLERDSVKLLLGVLTFLTAMLKLLSSVHGDIPVLGDIIPALTGIAAGFSLLLDYYRSKSSVSSPIADKLAFVFIDRRVWIGYAAMASALLHFLFPTVALL